MSSEAMINTWFDGFDDRFRSAVPNVIAETAVEYYQERFMPGNEDWNGVKWQQLNPQYAAKKTRGKGRILTKNTFLMRSIRPSTVEATRVTISAGNSKVPYARIHNEGLKVQGIQYVKAHKRKNAFGRGKTADIKPHQRSVNFQMPRRQYMGFNRELNDIIINRLKKNFSIKK